MGFKNFQERAPIQSIFKNEFYNISYQRFVCTEFHLGRLSMVLSKVWEIKADSYMVRGVIEQTSYSSTFIWQYSKYKMSLAIKNK